MILIKTVTAVSGLLRGFVLQLLYLWGWFFFPLSALNFRHGRCRDESVRSSPSGFTLDTSKPVSRRRSKAKLILWSWKYDRSDTEPIIDLIFTFHSINSICLHLRVAWIEHFLLICTSFCLLNDNKIHFKLFAAGFGGGNLIVGMVMRMLCLCPPTAMHIHH